MSIDTSTELLVFKQESTAGTYDSAVETLSVPYRLRELSYQDQPERTDDGRYQSGHHFGQDENIATRFPVTASANLRLQSPEFGGGTTEPYEHKMTYKELLEASGLKVVGDGTETTDDTAGDWVIFPDESMTAKSLSGAATLRESETGIVTLRKAKGLMFNTTIAAENTGAPVMITFDGEGNVGGDPEEIAAGADAPSIDEDEALNTDVIRFAGMEMKLTDLSDSSEHLLCVSSITIATGNQIKQVECQDSDSGIAYAKITEIQPTIEINPLLKNKSEFDWWAAITGGKFKLEITSDVFDLTVPKCEVNEQEIADSDGIKRKQQVIRPLTNDGTVPAWVTVGDVSNPKYTPYYMRLPEQEV